MKLCTIVTLAILGLSESVRGQDFGNQGFEQFNGGFNRYIDNSPRQEDTTATFGDRNVVPMTFGTPQVAPVKTQPQDEDAPAKVKPQGEGFEFTRVGIDRGGSDRFKKERPRVGRQ